MAFDIFWEGLEMTNFYELFHPHSIPKYKFVCKTQYFLNIILKSEKIINVFEDQPERGQTRD